MVFHLDPPDIILQMFKIKTQINLMLKKKSNIENTSCINVLTAEKYPLSAKYLKILLTRNMEIKYLGNAFTLDEIKSYLINWNVDVIVLDIEIIIDKEEEIMQFFASTYPQLKILIYSDFDFENYKQLKQFVRYGASGFISKDSDYTKVIEAIKIAFLGETSFETQLGNTFKQKILESYFNL